VTASTPANPSVLDPSSPDNGSGPLTVAAYGRRWLREVGANVKPQTLERYARVLRLHILPALGETPLVALSRPMIRQLLSRRARPASPRARRGFTWPCCARSCRPPWTTSSLAANPAFGLGRRLRFLAEARRTKVVALTRA
jgi:hypothetical protein